MTQNLNFYNHRRILITGHTGFIGSWLTQWLNILNAEICGYSLDPPSQPNMFEALKLHEKIIDIRGNVNDSYLLREALKSFRPEVVFHLAAQPIVLASYDNPVETFQSNVTGTVTLLNEIRKVDSVKDIVVMTSDKTYRNNEWVYPYRETDSLGGWDPYSASKSCQDIVIDSFRKSYFHDAGIGISSVRAGNVVGGGDWGKYRIVPDLVKGIVNGETVIIRNPDSVRPWQYVLEPISGMILLAQKMHEDIKFSGALNLGPNNNRDVTVKELVEKFIDLWGKGRYEIQQNSNFGEANILSLDINKAKKVLGWFPKYTFDEALTKTVEWYKKYYEQVSVDQMTKNQIDEYMRK